MSAPSPVRDVSRDGSPAGSCVVCGRAPQPSRRARYCSRACQPQAYRLRHHSTTPLAEPALRQKLRQLRTLAAHTLYECPICQERFLGQRRCPECNRFCRAIGLGGRCPDCDIPILLSDLLDLEVPT